jgi:hypothetical protein
MVGFARRSGNEWFVSIINGTDRLAEWNGDMAFLGAGEFEGTIYRDAAPYPTGISTSTGEVLRRDSKVQVELDPGGAWVGWIRPRVQPK